MGNMSIGGGNNSSQGGNNSSQGGSYGNSSGQGGGVSNQSSSMGSSNNNSNSGGGIASSTNNGEQQRETRELGVDEAEAESNGLMGSIGSAAMSAFGWATGANEEEQQGQGAQEQLQHGGEQSTLFPLRCHR